MDFEISYAETRRGGPLDRLRQEKDNKKKERRKKRESIPCKKREEKKKESPFPVPSPTLTLTLSLTLSPNNLANELLRRTIPTVQSNILYRHDIE